MMSPMCMQHKRYSVAVRPTEEEVQQQHLYYDKAYYEDRAKTIVAINEHAAVQQYIEDDRAKFPQPSIGIKVGDHLFLQRQELKYVRAKELS